MLGTGGPMQQGPYHITQDQMVCSLAIKMFLLLLTTMLTSCRGSSSQNSWCDQSSAPHITATIAMVLRSPKCGGNMQCGSQLQALVAIGGILTVRACRELLLEHTFPKQPPKLPLFQMPTKRAPNEAHILRLNPSALVVPNPKAQA